MAVAAAETAPVLERLMSALPVPAVETVKALPEVVLKVVPARVVMVRLPVVTLGVWVAVMVPEQLKTPPDAGSQSLVAAPASNRNQSPEIRSRRSSRSAAAAPVTAPMLKRPAAESGAVTRRMPLGSMLAGVPVVLRLRVAVPVKAVWMVMVSAESVSRATSRVMRPLVPARLVMARESSVPLPARETEALLVRVPAMVAVSVALMVPALVTLPVMVGVLARDRVPLLVRLPVMAAVLARDRVPALVRLPVMAAAPVAWSCAPAAMVVVVARRWAAWRERVPAVMSAVVKALLLAWVPVKVKVAVPVLSRLAKPVQLLRLARSRVPAPARSRVASVRLEVTAPVMEKPVLRVRVWVAPPPRLMAVVVPVTEPARLMAMLPAALLSWTLMPVAPETELVLAMVMVASPLPAWVAAMAVALVSVVATVPVRVAVRVVALAPVVMVRALPEATLNWVPARSLRVRGPVVTEGVWVAVMVPEQVKVPPVPGSQSLVAAPAANRIQSPEVRSRRSSRSPAEAPVTVPRVTVPPVVGAAMRRMPSASMLAGVPVALRLRVAVPVKLVEMVRVSAESLLRATSRVTAPLPARVVVVRESSVPLPARETEALLVRVPAMVAVSATDRVPALVTLPVMVVAPVVWRVALAALVKVPSWRLAAWRLMVPALWAKEVKRLVLPLPWVPVIVQVPAPVLVTAPKPEMLVREKAPVVLVPPERLRPALPPPARVPCRLVVVVPPMRLRVRSVPPVSVMEAAEVVVVPALTVTVRGRPAVPVAVWAD